MGQRMIVRVQSFHGSKGAQSDVAVLSPLLAPVLHARLPTYVVTMRAALNHHN